MGEVRRPLWDRSRTVGRREQGATADELAVEGLQRVPGAGGMPALRAWSAPPVFGRPQYVRGGAGGPDGASSHHWRTVSRMAWARRIPPWGLRWMPSGARIRVSAPLASGR